MYKSLFAYTAAAAICVAVNTAQAMPVTSGALRDAADATDMMEKTAIYVVEGRRYCFYFSGWHGPGWYRCGYAFRRGLGWGGVYGWQGWEYGPAARRLGGGSVTIRESSRGSREGTTIRSRSSVREGATVRGSVQERSTTTTREGATVRGGTSVESRTTGSDVSTGAKVKGGGEMKRSGGAARGGGEVKGGGEGGASMGGSGGASMGGSGGRGGDKQ